MALKNRIIVTIFFFILEIYKNSAILMTFFNVAKLIVFQHG